MIEQQPEQQHEELTRMVEPEIIKMGGVQRVISIFVAPGELMRNIKAYPVILVPFLLAVVLGLLAVPSTQVVSDMMNQEMINISFERYGRDVLGLDTLANEYGDPILDADTMNMITIITLVATALIAPFFVGFLATLLLFILSKIFRGKGTFGQLFSMVMHIYVISALGGLVVAFLMAITGSLTDMTSLAAILSDGDISTVSHNVMSGIAIFPIWWTILTFIGVKEISEICSVRAGIIAVIYFLVGLAIHVGTYMMTWVFLDIAAAAGTF